MNWESKGEDAMHAREGLKLECPECGGDWASMTILDCFPPAIGDIRCKNGHDLKPAFNEWRDKNPEAWEKFRDSL
jgi:hypothetical protein